MLYVTQDKMCFACTTSAKWK